MLWIGIVLMLAGFVVVAPRGATAGGVAHRNVQMGIGGGIVTTPGYQGDAKSSSQARPMIRVVVGVATLAVGLGIIIAFA